MNFQVIVRNRATQDLRLQANYILVKGNRDAAERFLASAVIEIGRLLRGGSE